MFSLTDNKELDPIWTTNKIQQIKIGAILSIKTKQLMILTSKFNYKL